MLERPCRYLAGHREQINIIAMVRSRSAEGGHGFGSQSGRNSNARIRRVLFTRKTEVERLLLSEP